jgi:hypothetical protein
MRSMKWLLAALILTSVAACGDLHTASGPASRADERHQTEFGDFGYSDIYRYYGGPSAVSQQSDAQREADRQVTKAR